MSEYRGPERRKKKSKLAKSISKEIKAAFAIITLIFFLTLAGFAWLVEDISDNSDQLTILVSENQNRIADIQSARIESCEKTYAGIKEVFKPFFQPPPRTSEQQDNLDKFNDTIKLLQKGCAQQTGQG